MGRGSNNSVSSVPTRLRCLFLLATILGASFFILFLNYNIDIILLNRKFEILKGHNIKYEARTLDSRSTINTEGCRIPELLPLNEDIKKFVKFPKELQPCRHSKHPLLGNNRTHIWIRQFNKRHYNTSLHDRLVCCYMSFYRPNFVNDIESVFVDDRVKYNKCIIFTEVIEVSDDFVKVQCSRKGMTIYEQFFAFTPRKNISLNGDDKAININNTYNIIIMGVDSVSRLNFNRTMPKTLKFLKNRGAVELFGYNKVADNTFPNIMPILLGVKEADLKNTCLPSQLATFDNCPFIWEWFKQIGYYTAFAEDSSYLGTFNYRRSGFARTPTDYYLHTFIHEAERNVGNNKDFNTFLCMNEKYFYKVLLRYIEDLTITLKSDRLFGFFWETTMSHDYLNYPMIMDDDYEHFLHNLDVSKYLETTILIIISDHGIRWGKFRATKQGRLEERLPFVYVLVPESFRSKYAEAYKNLKLNSKRLTTPFDIYATLYDLINMNNIQDEEIKVRKQKPYSRNKGVSLFLPILTNRTCKKADIDDHWCTCQRTSKLPTRSVEAVTAASQLLRHLNTFLNVYRKCALLKLIEIIEISEVEIVTKSVEVGRREFVIVIRTEPGNAIFEATLGHDKYQNWFVDGTVSRLNLYGEQSHCVNNHQLKLYCYCI